jgi:hypothetical protein
MANEYAIVWHTTSGGAGVSTGGDYALSGTVGQPGTGQMTGGDYGLTGGFWPGVPSVCGATAVRSCLDHGPAGRLCLEMGVSGGVEPRVGGIIELEIDLDDAGGVSVSDTATVNCSVAWSGTATVTAVVGNTVTVEFTPTLPNQAYCTITLDCGAEVCVRMIEGDMNRDSDTNPTDASSVKLRFAQTVTDANCEWDFNRDGDINPTDASSVKLRFGYAAPECP